MSIYFHCFFYAGVRTEDILNPKQCFKKIISLISFMGFKIVNALSNYLKWMILKQCLVDHKYLGWWIPNIITKRIVEN